MKLKKSKLQGSPKDPSRWDVIFYDRISRGVLYLSHPEMKEPVPLLEQWLRDACTCPSCVDPSSGQKLFSTCDLPDKTHIKSARKTEDGSLEVTWKDDFHTFDDHVSVYPREQIEYYLGNIPDVPKTEYTDLRLWNRAELEELNPFYDYDEFMTGGETYVRALSMMCTRGLFFLRNVPQDKESVERIAEKLGIIYESFYGRTWDVVSKPNAENVAYTNSYLGLHADLLYMRNPPRLQLLHCLKNTCEGGSSLFSDGLRARFALQGMYPAAVEVLRQRRIMYWYHKNGIQRCKWHPVFGGNLDVLWSPPFQSPEQEIRKSKQGSYFYLDWLKAARKFRDLLEDEKSLYEYKLQPGDCAVFNNLRVLHGRRAFDTSEGERWLRGTYVEDESFIDKVRQHAAVLPKEGYVPMALQVEKYFSEPKVQYRFKYNNDE